MKILVFGASGKTGLQILKKGLSSGHEISAFVRNPQKLSYSHEKLKIIKGDVYDVQSIRNAVENHDAVIIALGTGQSLGKTDVRERGTENIIQAMKHHKIKRLIAISAMGVGESWKELSLINRLFFATVLKNSRQDHEGQEQQIKESRLDWTIVRPSGLTDLEETGNYIFGEGVQAKTSRISRADIAHLVFRILDDSSTHKRAITITN